MGAQPLWCRSRQGVQSRAQRLDRAAQAVEGPHGSEHVGAVGALSTAGHQKLVLPAQCQKAQCQKRVEQQGLSPAGHEPRSELAEHGGVEARVGQLQAKPTPGQADISNRSDLGRPRPPADPTGFRQTAAR